MWYSRRTLLSNEFRQSSKTKYHIWGLTFCEAFPLCQAVQSPLNGSLNFFVAFARFDLSSHVVYSSTESQRSSRCSYKLTLKWLFSPSLGFYPFLILNLNQYSPSPISRPNFSNGIHLRSFNWLEFTVPRASIDYPTMKMANSNNMK